MKIISREYNKLTIDFSFFNDDNLYINATKVAKEFNKLPADWLKTKETKAYLEAFSRYDLYHNGIHNGDFIVVRQGGIPQEQGTWIHRKLIIAFARWLSPDFAVWCDMTIEQLLQTPEIAHKPIQNETFDLNFYSQEIEKMAKLVEFLNSKNTKILYYLDNLSKSLNIKSPLELLKIDLSNYYFIPTELGNFINASPVETNKILEARGFQIRENDSWILTEKGRDFGIEVQKGSYFQLKWKIKSII